MRYLFSRLKLVIYSKLVKILRSIIIDFLRSRSLYWKFRHLFEPSVWQVYQESATFDKCQYFSDFVVNHDVTSVFEYGCASAPNLINIAANVDKPVELIGFDINSAAIKLAKKTLPFGFFFSKKSHLFEFLAQRNTPHLDLVIFDRVLYLLSDREIYNILTLLSGKARYMIIDDSHSDLISDHGSFPYPLRNYVDLFSEYSCLNIDDSQHSAHQDNTLSFAKRIVLELSAYSSSPL